MLRNNKGITLSALVITIIVLIIIASVASISGISATHYIKFQNAKLQFQVMQSKVDSWYEEVKNNPDILNYGNDLSDADATIVSNTIKNGTGKEDNTGYRYFNADYVKNTLNIDGISFDFLINIKERSVLLYGGIIYQDKSYYSASDFEINIVDFEAQTDFKIAKLQMEKVRNAIQPLYREYKKIHGQEEVRTWINANFEGNIWYTDFDTSLDMNKVSDTLKSVSDTENSEGYFYITSECIQQSLNLEDITCDFLINLGKSNILIYDGIFYQEKKYYTAKDFGVEDLKDEFTRIEYLQSTGLTDKQYIDTEYKLKKNTKIVVDGMVVSGDTALFGARDGSNGNSKFLLQYVASNKYRVTYKDIEYIIYDDLLNTVNVRYKFELDKNILKINNIVPCFKVVNVREFNSTGIDGKNNIFLFALNNSLDNVASNFGVVRIYLFKIYENNELVKEFIPVLDADGEPCFYEKVSKTFFYNKGQGKFDYKTIEESQVINKLQNVSLSNKNINVDEIYQTKLIPDQSRGLPKELCIKIGTNRLKSNEDYFYNQETGDLSIYKNIIGNITIDEITSYNQVNYIISNERQYINTGVKPKSTTKVVLEHYPRYRVPTRRGKYFGYVKNMENNNAFFVSYGPTDDYNNGSMSAYVGGTYYGNEKNIANSVASETIDDTAKETIILSSTEFKTEVSNNYTETISGLKTASTPIFDGTERDIFLFGCNYGEKEDVFYVEEAPVTMRFKSMKIYEGDTLVRDFIPIKDSDNVYAVYDLVNNKYYYNQGIGEFTGPE